jgi:DmsE family decaheme c-type cytochrome
VISHTVKLSLAAVGLCGLLGMVASSAPDAAAAEPAGTPTQAAQPAYSEKGADTCLMCHANAQVLPIFKTKHGNRADPRSPMAGLQCEACHGPGGEHVKAMMSGKMVPPPVTFGPEEHSTPQQENGACLQCHENHERIGWKGSPHQQNDVTCSQCHHIHVARDPVLVRSEQADVCYRCHKPQRAESYEASAHPIRYGKMDCSDCHSPHGSPGSYLLIKATVNETCYTCHADKRGPFLWEHAPASENCDLCHRPHGSNHLALLKKVPPYLCQQCHAEIGHPSVFYNGTGIPPVGADRAMLAQGCLNCHSQVHGSNHPSGATLLR